MKTAQPQNQSPRERNYSLGYKPGLDGLRGLAILLVILLHANIEGFSGGFYGVDLFFVLSGFLITSILGREFTAKQDINFTHFYRRRVLRLFPAAALMSFLLLLFAYFFIPDFTQIKRDVIASLTYTANWTRAFALNCPVFLGHTWSLAVEEQFYLLWPLLLYLWLKRSARAAPAALFALGLAGLSMGLRAWLVLSGQPFWRIYNGFDTHCDAMFLGAASALAVNLRPESNLAKRVNRYCLRLWPVALTGMAALIAVSRFEQKYVMLYGYAGFAIFSAILILACNLERKTWFSPLLCSRPLVYLGRISYGLYLWHYTLLYVLANVLQVPNPYFLLIGLPAVFCVSALSYHFLEKPLLGLRYLPDNALGRLLNALALGLTACSLLLGLLYFFA